MSDHDFMKLTPKQLELLNTLAVKPYRAWEFASGTLSSLRRAGLIAKDWHPDGGSVFYRITDAGRAALAGGK